MDSLFQSRLDSGQVNDIRSNPFGQPTVLIVVFKSGCDTSVSAIAILKDSEGKEVRLALVLLVTFTSNDSIRELSNSVAPSQLGKAGSPSLLMRPAIRPSQVTDQNEVDARFLHKGSQLRHRVVDHPPLISRFQGTDYDGEVIKEDALTLHRSSHVTNTVQ